MFCISKVNSPAKAGEFFVLWKALARQGET